MAEEALILLLVSLYTNDSQSSCLCEIMSFFCSFLRKHPFPFCRRLFLALQWKNAKPAKGECYVLGSHHRKQILSLRTKIDWWQRRPAFRMGNHVVLDFQPTSGSYLLEKEYKSFPALGTKRMFLVICNHLSMSFYFWRVQVFIGWLHLLKPSKFSLIVLE